MKLLNTFHSLVAILYQRQYGVSKRLLKDRADISLNHDIKNGSMFIHWLTHDEDDECFELLKSKSLIIRVDSLSSYDCDCFRLDLQYDTLREQLIRRSAEYSFDTSALIGRFIDRAYFLGRYPVIGKVNLLGIPIHKDWFEVPNYFDSAMREVAELGYCVFFENTAKWTNAATGIMTERGFWVGEFSAEEIRKS
jgi:hypothetical protein